MGQALAVGLSLSLAHQPSPRALIEAPKPQLPSLHPHPGLQALVFQLEQASSDDYRLDTPLVAACKADISRLCSGQVADPHGGEVQVGARRARRRRSHNLVLRQLLEE